MATMYADYCPISTAVEILGDRWTPLVLRELMVGAGGFNEIHRGIPRASRTLLSQRLRLLERRGLVTRTPASRGLPGGYQLTPAGAALTPVIWGMGRWAAEWVFCEPSEETLDGLSLLWRLHQHVNVTKLPPGRTVVHLRLTGTGGAEAWLDLRPEGATVCRDDQGLNVDLAVEADNRQMHRWLFGLVTFRELVSSGEARLLGPSRLSRAFPSWFDTSSFGADLRRGADRRPEFAEAV